MKTKRIAATIAAVVDLEESDAADALEIILHLSKDFAKSLEGREGQVVEIVIADRLEVV